MNTFSKMLAVVVSAAVLALPTSEASAKLRKRDVAIGLGVLGAAVIIAAGAASARERDRPRRVERFYDDGPRHSCRDLRYLCKVEDRGWACEKYYRRCR